MLDSFFHVLLSWIDNLIETVFVIFVIILHHWILCMNLCLLRLSGCCTMNGVIIVLAVVNICLALGIECRWGSSCSLWNSLRIRNHAHSYNMRNWDYRPDTNWVYFISYFPYISHPRPTSPIFSQSSPCNAV